MTGPLSLERQGSFFVGGRNVHSDALSVLPQLAALPLREVHASCSVNLPSGGAALAFGFQSGHEKRTERGTVAALKQALLQLAVPQT